MIGGPPKITPASQAGSWMLADFLIIVAKKGAYGAPLDSYLVEVVSMPDNNVVIERAYFAKTPCEAAVVALVGYFGTRHKVVNEFVTHYDCNKDGSSAPPLKSSGYKVDADLDGTPGNVPAWIRR